MVVVRLLEGTAFEWDESATARRLVRRTPRVAHSVQRYRIACLPAALAYVCTNVWGSMALVLFGGAGALATLWAASWASVDVEANRRRQWVQRDLAFSMTPEAEGYRSSGPGELIIDGDRVGSPTSICLVRWVDNDAYSRVRSMLYEVAIVVGRRVFVVDDSSLEGPMRALALQISESVGLASLVLERTVRRWPGRTMHLWAATFLPALVILPLSTDRPRRALIACAVVVAALSNILVRSAWIAERAPTALRNAYGDVTPTEAGTNIPFGYALAVALLAQALLWASILVPGGPSLP
jgi:hypothetical protein